MYFNFIDIYIFMRLSMLYLYLNKVKIILLKLLIIKSKYGNIIVD